MKSIKQIANELGVSKTAVNKKIANLELKTKLSVCGNQYMVNEEQEKLIKSAFLEKESQTANRKPNDKFAETIDNQVCDIIALLKAELDAKDRQIERLQNENERLIGALENTTESLKASQALQANAEKKLLAIEEQKEEKKPFWRRR